MHTKIYGVTIGFGTDVHKNLLSVCGPWYRCPQ